jgi:hypothetical protein
VRRYCILEKELTGDIRWYRINAELILSQRITCYSIGLGSFIMPKKVVSVIDILLQPAKIHIVSIIAYNLLY